MFHIVYKDPESNQLSTYVTRLYKPVRVSQVLFAIKCVRFLCLFTLFIDCQSAIRSSVWAMTVKESTDGVQTHSWPTMCPTHKPIHHTFFIQLPQVSASGPSWPSCLFWNTVRNIIRHIKKSKSQVAKSNNTIFEGLMN